MIQDIPNFRVILALCLVVTCGVEGCSIPQSLSLSLSLFGGRKTHNSLQCHLCLDRKTPSRRNYTFTLTRNGKAAHISQVVGRKMSYSLDNKRNNSGLWTCNVQEFPHLRAEYYLGPPTPAPPATKKDTEAPVPASTMSSRILLTVVTAALLLIILVSVISFTSGICIMKQCRKASAPHQRHRDRERSDNFPLTENLSSDLSNPKRESDTEVSYVELEIIRDPSRKPSKSYNTIYANIM